MPKQRQKGTKKDRVLRQRTMRTEIKERVEQEQTGNRVKSRRRDGEGSGMEWEIETGKISRGREGSGIKWEIETGKISRGREG